MSDQPQAAVSVGKGVALAFVAALGMTLLMAAPVVRAPTQRIFGSGAVVGRDDPNRDALVVIDQFRTGRVPAPYLQPLTDLPGRALARVVGPVAAYNIVVLVTFPLAAAAAYLLARAVVGSHPAAMIAALAYAFLPFHVAQAAGHPHAAQTQWLPLYLLALWRCADRPDRRRAAALIAAAGAVALSDFYGGFIAAVLSPVALLAWAVVSPRRSGEGRVRGAVITGLVLALAAAVAVACVAAFAPAVLERPNSLAFARSELFAWSAKWWSYLTPPAEHPWWGPVVRAFWARHEVGESLLEHQQVGVGVSLLAFAAVPLWRWIRGDRASLAVRSAPVLAAVAAAALLCSLSPERRIGALTFVRPSALLYAIAPMFRAYARFAVAVGLMTAVLAGAGAACLWRGKGTRGRVAAVLLLVLAALEYAPFPPWRSRDVLPTRAHRWLAAQPGALRVLDCVPPLRVSDTLGASMLGHDAALLGRPFFDDCGEPGLAGKLRAMGYTHVVVRRASAVGRWLDAHPPTLGLAPGPAFEDASILEVKSERPAAYVGEWIGFEPREYEGNATWRWMGPTGALRIVATRGSAGTVLELEMKSFPAARRVGWLENGQRRGEIDVTSGWARYALRIGRLEAGETRTITLSCGEPAVVADDVLHNADPRALCVAVGSVRLYQAEGL